MITVENLHKRFGQVVALQGVSLTVDSGEIFGLMGANGAGKTTMIRVLIGATRPTEGRVSVFSLNPMTHARQVRKQIGYMPQAPALYEDLSARANIRFFARAHELDNLEDRVDEVLDFVDLRERQHDAVYGFSGGMKQRVSLACALVHRPKVLLLDEPTAGVDPKLRETFWQHFRQLAAEGVTILVSTHQMDEAFHCNRLAIMRAGQVLVSDTPQKVMERGQTRVKIQQSGATHEATLQNYPTELPALMQYYPQAERIDIQQDTLEDVVLSLIRGVDHD
ncbi:MAG: ABC transporter ATP-binding protein [Anaerolineales bacterium]|nr:ABC transporter ATP-binding protein [Anaerolineales bacterium]